MVWRDGRDQRRFKRTRVSLEVGISAGPKFRMESGVQLSEGGMLLVLNDKPTVGDQLELCFSVPGDEVVIAYAEIAYVIEESNGQYLAGLRFLFTSVSARECIKRYVESIYPTHGIT